MPVTANTAKGIRLGACPKASARMAREAWVKGRNDSMTCSQSGILSTGKTCRQESHGRDNEGIQKTLIRMRLDSHRHRHGEGRENEAVQQDAEPEE